MPDPAPRIIFNRYPIPRTPDQDTLYVYGDDPVIQLTQPRLNPRNSRQQQAIDTLKDVTFTATSPTVESMFGPSTLQWAFAIFDLTNLGLTSNGVPDPPPVSTQTASERQTQLKNALSATPQEPQPICLFNVIVALEWMPSDAYLLQLKWAFRRGSDFLYDATDGAMAFGQVVFGGPELMSCADISIMASNRMHPRSWVGGLIEPTKYQPIRLGRGIWHERNRIVLPWDEPEGYRTIIHEWAHYALELMDAYIEIINPDELDTSVVVPKMQINGTSIMESLEGTSELFSQMGGRSPSIHKNAWDVIHSHYPALKQPTKQLNGPGRLPLPLPIFRTTTALVAAQDPAAHIQAYVPALASASTAASLLPTLLNSDFVQAATRRKELCNPAPSNTLDLRKVFAGRCWIYVVHTSAADSRIIAQGTLDARMVEEDFELLGAQAGDDIYLAFENPIGSSILYKATLATQADRLIPSDWARIPGQPHIIDVIPIAQTSNTMAIQVGESIVNPVAGALTLKLRIHSETANQRPSGTATGGSGQVKAIMWPVQPSADSHILAGQDVQIAALDGHVLVTWPDGSAAISTFSYGGGPPTHGGISPGSPADDGSGLESMPQPIDPASPTIVKTPITAGSSDGRVMIFFDPVELIKPSATSQELEQYNTLAERQAYYETLRVVTTALRGIDLPLPNPNDLPGSGLYSVAATRPIPSDLFPTLVVYLDPLDIQPHRTPLICLWRDGEWQKIATTQLAAAGKRYVYIPLKEAGLVADIASYADISNATNGSDAPEPICVQVYWVPE